MNKFKNVFSCLMVALIALVIGYTIWIPNGKMEEKDNKIAIMLHNLDGTEELGSTNSFNPIGYIFDLASSSCENTSEITYSEENGVGVKVKGNDKCTLHFNQKTADLGISNITVDGVKVNSIPTATNYTVNPSCTGATGTWDYSRWALIISAVTSATPSCTLAFTTVTPSQTLSQYIIANSVDTPAAENTTNQIIHETFVYSNTTYDTGYRYEGSNPNNYVKFNNELWRIIGTFSVIPAGESSPEYLTKIIRNDSIGSYAYDNSSSNGSSIWITQDGTRKASLNYLLNDYYYLRQDGTDSGYCVFSNYNNTNVMRTCDFSSIGINTAYRSMIEEVTWNIGGASSSNNPKDAYRLERGTSKPSGSANTWDGYIGLMYPSDFGFSVLSTSCARTIGMSAYNTNACGGHAWLLNYGYEWTMSPYSTYATYVLYVNYYGIVESNSAYYGLAVRPVLYLKSNVYIVDGDGSVTNPYILNGGSV